MINVGKKIIFLATIVILLLTHNASCFAEISRYEIKDIGIRISFPADYTVFTRELDNANGDFNKFGFVKEELKELMNEQKMYMDTVKDDVSEEITIILGYDQDIKNFNDYNDVTINEIISGVVDNITEEGVEVLDTSIYRHNQIKFIKTSTKYLGVHIIQYITGVRGKTYTFTFKSFNKMATPSQEMLWECIMDTVKFDDIPSKYTYTKTDSKQETQNTYILIIVITVSVLATVIFIMLFLREKSKKKHLQALISNDKPYECCSECGEKLTGDSPYCHICGTKVIK
ncbi:MAG: zinc ribbon domain-containing protein [Clostridia bacterium]|nr:zinc ribbon domain-containing protein [Clostridia bacterium]